ncbi:5'-methylthioadenosine/S-adenosylhomocysteine nucleosidase [Limnohabitans curvus]|mgnify:FL=1|jgi:adenosylhomocysteine nucleosidase|uniref:adenosylhomocysteine nucleosidase n=1 Tax=Limnohabitans curvus TaxID=323423 RepID=A0A315EPW4_9BURK|nr:5'-methylthioadenosine/adenosylhomocysteine nucleosidase [Limnohabitans curvus]PUE59261.1 5'-methylthioadenosine/S-adenosylhomocysteine nucleosidase [Limnohabitans curvus]
MSRIALVSAMHEELAAVLARMPNEHKTVVAGREFWVGHWHGHDVVAVLSRIGKVAAATTATTLIERFGVSRIVFTGVAGGLAPHVNVGDVVVAREFIQHDMDASPLFPRHEVPLTGMTRFLADPVLSDALAAAAPFAMQDMLATLPPNEWLNLDLPNAKVHQGLIASGDRFVSQTLESQTLQRDLPHALAVEMECAAMAQVCHDYGVPLAAVRTISDRADDAAHVDFPRFIQSIASRYSVAVLDRLLSTLAV